MEAVAVHSFTPTEEDELGFEKGSILYIVEMEEDPNWYKARQGEHEGMIPANYITMTPHPWYVPKCSRLEAESRLLEVDPFTNEHLQPDGAFILRQSENGSDQFSLSVKDGAQVLHFRIFFKPPNKYHIWNNRFRSINELIEYHRHQTVYGDKTLLLRDCVTSKSFGPVGASLSAKSRHPAKQGNNERKKPSRDHQRISDSARHDSGGHERHSTLANVDLPPGISSTHLAGRYCLAKFDFSAEFEGEMSFRRGDQIRILGEEDENWWYGELLSSQSDRHSTRRGMIPANYVELLPPNKAGVSNSDREKFLAANR